LGCRRSQTPELAWQPDGGWSNEAFPTARSVYFKRLQAFLPTSLPGFRQVRDEGSTGKYGDVTVSEAERVFAQADNRELVIRIVDSTMLDRLGEGIRAATLEATRLNKPEIAGVLQLPEAVGYFRYDAAEERADANLLVGDRFIVSIASRGFQGGDEVRRVAQSLDSGELSKLR
jgi:hypothetical protein